MRDTRRIPILATVLVLSLALSLILPLTGCRGTAGPRELERFPVDDLDHLLTTRNVDLDTTETSDGHGSLHFFAPGKRLVNLYTVSTAGVKGPCDLVWSLNVRTVMLIGALDAEVWLFPHEGEPRMVRDHLDRVHQTVEWTHRDFRVPVRDGERIDRVRLAVHTNGMGHVWLDDMTLRVEPTTAAPE